jgi:dTDP-4-amino-4,6-dideoxygalactose transaminase
MLKPTRLSIWPTLPLSVHSRRPSGRLPFPLEEQRHRVYSRARHGLWQGVRALGIGPGGSVLVPSYHHGSEVEALEQAGLVCRFYEVDPDLQPSQDVLEDLLTPDVRALYLIHYFGMPQAADRWREWCDRHDLFLVEDAAMAFLAAWKGRPVGSFGHLAFFCLYKTFPLPDGGATISTANLPGASSKPSLGLEQTASRTGSWLAQRSRLFSTVHHMTRGDRETEWGTDFDLGDPSTPASRVTARLIPRVVDARAAARRRANYRFLHEQLGDRLNVLVPELSEGSCPIAYMFRLDPEPQRVVRRSLADGGVQLANFWMAPHPAVPNEGFQWSRCLRSSVVGLPVHQELRAIDLERIALAMGVAMRRAG